jgi:hypothetical protein
MKRPPKPVPTCEDCGGWIAYIGVHEGSHWWECVTCEQGYEIPQQDHEQLEQLSLWKDEDDVQI